jgi:TorA maturation chaperone TorD
MNQLPMNEPQSAGRTADRGLNLARQAIYRFASLAFLDPRAGSWEQLTDAGIQDCVRAAAELIRTEAIADSAEPGLGEFPPSALDPASLIARLPGSADELNAEYESTFGLLVSSDCPPYETEYIDSKFSFQRSQELAEIAGYYQAFGLQPSDRHRERQDHLSLELEFMAVVIGLEMRAAAQPAGDPAAGNHGARERIIVCREAQARFLGDHLAWWVPALARLLDLLHGDGFYAASARLLAALMPVERALLGVPAKSGGAQPHSLERPEECEGCLLQP